MFQITENDFVESKLITEFLSVTRDDSQVLNKKMIKSQQTLLFGGDEEV